MPAQDQDTVYYPEQVAREMNRIFAPITAQMLTIAEAWEHAIDVLAESFNSMEPDNEPTAVKRQAVPYQHQRKTQRRKRDMHSRRFQAQRR